jgi:hypothetical protein
MGGEAVQCNTSRALAIAAVIPNQSTLSVVISGLDLGLLRKIRALTRDSDTLKPHNAAEAQQMQLVMIETILKFALFASVLVGLDELVSISVFLHLACLAFDGVGHIQDARENGTTPAKLALKTALFVAI